MEQELLHDRRRIDHVSKRQDGLEDEVRLETSDLQELKRRAKLAISEFETTGANHLEAAGRMMAEAVRRANDPQRIAMEQMRTREIARDKTEKRKFIVQLAALAMTSISTISAGYFVSRSGSHEGAHQALTEQHLVVPAVGVTTTAPSIPH